MSYKWIALFSQTGRELSETINTLRNSVGESKYMVPHEIWTDRDNQHMWPDDISHRVRLGTHEKIMERILSANYNVGGPHIPTLVTLHGYLRIIPEDVINTKGVELYNCHPGDIVHHRELKGKDPQAKAIQMGLPSTAVVIHKVEKEVDSGEIILYNYHSIAEGTSEAKLIKDLREKATKLWEFFLKSKLPKHYYSVNY